MARIGDKSTALSLSVCASVVAYRSLWIRARKSERESESKNAELWLGFIKQRQNEDYDDDDDDGGYS